MTPKKSPNKDSSPAFVLVIGGSDPSGGAGIQIDLLTLGACGVHGLSAISALTIQNSRGITRVTPTPSKDLQEQVIACLEDFPVSWVKTGILPDPDLVKIVAGIVQKYKLKCVVDPILKSGKGFTFAQEETVQAYVNHLCPQASVITPNLGELQQLVEAVTTEKEVSVVDPQQLALKLVKVWNTSIVAKGGHRSGPIITDFLLEKDKVWRFSHPRLPFKQIHGAGCCFASAIAGYCAKGLSIPAAVADAEHLFELAMLAGWTWNETTFLDPLHRITELGLELLLREEVGLVVSTLEGNPIATNIIPEVRTNVSILALGGATREQVAAVDGRITIIGGQVKAAGPVRFACSNHTARLLLACRGVDPRIRAVMNLKYSPTNVAACDRAGLRCVEIARNREPSSQKTTELGTMEWIPSQIKDDSSEFPDVVYDTGDFGKEAMIRLFGHSGKDLQVKLQKILVHVKE